MLLNNKTLEHVGTSLYGPFWQTQLSRDLNVNDRTMRRWLIGEFNMPETIWPEIAALCRARGAALTKLAKELSR